MKQDIDKLMEAQDLDAILVTGPAQNNPAMVYLTGIAHLTNADLIKKRGTACLFRTDGTRRSRAHRTAHDHARYAL
jgi:hypothetical protein